MQKEQQSAELTILNYIEQNSDATQRELSQEVGVSLGMINILLKRMIRTGLIKIERLQPNSIKYFLTPKGIANKIERTYGYVVRTYNQINKVRSTIVSVSDRIADNQETESLIFFGEEDQLSEMIADLIQTRSFTMDAVIIHEKDQLLAYLGEKSQISESKEQEKNTEEEIRVSDTEQKQAAASKRIKKHAPVIVWAEEAERVLREEKIACENLLRKIVI